MKLKSKAWLDLEIFNGEKYPQCIKNLLIASGYSKLMSLAEIDEEKLRKIEDHVNGHMDLVKSLICCHSKDYKNQTNFEFLPGHKATILGIKDKITQMKATGAFTLKANNRSIQPKYRSEIEVKTALVQSLDVFATSQGLPGGIITERNIVNFTSISENGKDVYKCGFSCVFCSKVIKVVYRSYWMKSNVTKHIKEHITAGFSTHGENIVVSF